MLLWRPGAGRKVAAGVGVLIAGAVVLATSVLAEGEVAAFAGAFGNVAPIVLLAVLAQLQWIWPALRPLVWLVFGLELLVGLALVVAATVMPFDVEARGDFPPDAVAALIVAIGLGALGLCGSLVLLIGGLWARLARWLGGQVDPTDPRHAQALVGLVAASTLAFVPMIALGGEAPALRVAEIDPGIFDRDRSTGGQLLDLVYDLAWTIPLALLLVGVPIQRTSARRWIGSASAPSAYAGWPSGSVPPPCSGSSGPPWTRRPGGSGDRPAGLGLTPSWWKR